MVQDRTTLSFHIFFIIFFLSIRIRSTCRNVYCPFFCSCKAAKSRLRKSELRRLFILDISYLGFGPDCPYGPVSPRFLITGNFRPIYVLTLEYWAEYFQIVSLSKNNDIYIGLS